MAGQASIFDGFLSSFDNQELFDKRINVKLKVKASVLGREEVLSGARSLDDSVSIECANAGAKPQISLKGNFILSPVVTDLQLRITNLSLHRPLSDYGSVEISAGYGNSLKQTLSGVIQYAYQETPGPDGVTAFLFFPTFKINEWVNSRFTKPSYPADTPIIQIFQDIATTLEVALDAKFDPSRTVGPAGFNASGALKDVALSLATSSGGGTGIVHGINVLSSPPRNDAAGWSLVAPWDPAIRPGDEVWFDPAYARSTFGGYLISKSAQFIVISIELEFSTVSPENTMKLVMVDKANFMKGSTT
jgi:hypothetical protein